VTSLPRRAPLLGAVITATLLLVAVCAAAVLSHVAIDVVGDYAPWHDTYDGVEHSSRLAVVVAAVGFSLLAILGLLWSACDAARSAHRAPPPRIARNVRLFVLGVVGLTVLSVAGMESLDVLATGDSLSGIADVFGGSLWLGLGISIVSGLLASALALRVARFIERTRSLLVRAIETLIAELSRRALCDPCIVRERPAIVHLLAVHIGRAHKRGPPRPA